MTAVVGARLVGGETAWTDEVRTTFQFDTNSATERGYLVASPTQLNLGAVALALVPVRTANEHVQRPILQSINQSGIFKVA